MAFKKCDYCGKWETHWLLLPNDDWKRCGICGKIYCDKCSPNFNFASILKLVEARKYLREDIPQAFIDVLKSIKSPVNDILNKNDLFKVCKHCIDKAVSHSYLLKVMLAQWDSIYRESYNALIIHPRDVRIVSHRYKGKIATCGARYQVESGWQDDIDDAKYELATIAAAKACDVVVNVETVTDIELNSPDSIDDVRTYTVNYMGDPDTEGEGEEIEVWGYDSKGDAIEALKEEAFDRDYDIIIDVDWERDGQEWSCSGTAYSSGSHTIYQCKGIATSLKEDGAPLQMPPNEMLLAVRFDKDRLVPTVNNLNKYADNYSSVFNEELLNLRRQLINQTYVIPDTAIPALTDERFDPNSEINAAKLRENIYHVLPFDKVCVSIAFGGNEAHHIIGNSPEEEDSRLKLACLQVDINSAINGILLCDRSADSIYTNIPIHNGKHSSSYHQVIYSRIRKCITRDDLISEMNNIKNDIVKGVIQLS